MALESILNMIKQRLPFLASGDDSMIVAQIIESYYFLQPQTKVLDDDVEDETKYSALQKMLFADLTAYNILNRKIILNMSGSEGVAPEVATILTKAKADVVEAEFGIVKAGDGAAMIMDSTKVLAGLRLSVCSKAGQLRYRIPQICAPIVLDTIPPFKVYC